MTTSSILSEQCIITISETPNIGINRRLRMDTERLREMVWGGKVKVFWVNARDGKFINKTKKTLLHLNREKYLAHLKWKVNIFLMFRAALNTSMKTLKWTSLTALHKSCYVYILVIFLFMLICSYLPLHCFDI